MTESPFTVRGVIEGFYGKPWSHSQRLDMIGFIARHGFNTFVYAPKDDPLVRREWRRPYLGAELARLGELVEACNSHGIDFAYCLSPGLSVEYSSEADRRLLTQKLDSIAELGVESFGLLLDDIPAKLQHPSDKAAFSSLVEAQLSMLNEVFSERPASETHYVCPTQYWGYGDEDYISALGRGLDRKVRIFWTGRAICSASLDLADAAVFENATGHPPTYWDNYPVNDVSMTNELHIGPYRGRAADLHKKSLGIISNAMELFESSKIPIATIGSFLADPIRYNPESSFADAIEEVAGSHAQHFAIFADNVRSSCLSADDAPVLQSALETFAFESEFGNRATAADELASLTATMRVAADYLRTGEAARSALISEAKPWLEAFATGAEALEKVVQLYREGKLNGADAEILRGYRDRLRDLRVRVFGDVLDMALSDLLDSAENAAAENQPQSSHSEESAS
ncbi:MAG: beta-N-acetylglucosaminidase domain-containing protein [Cryobacterium sp.]|nr:beta-N-acetylglucosaminidase domain-containing protein [Cryobacterium sp.]MBX3090033.1 beta-N-acetylglucosaminidase domain-containing protein [Cryobacterium sp.]